MKTGTVTLDTKAHFQMDRNINHLKFIKECLTVTEYKFAMASVITQAYTDYIRASNLTVTRKKVVDKVNELLALHGCKPVSYQFVRKYM